MDGNLRFTADKPLHCNLMGEVKATAKKQTSFACAPACIDSRSAPEPVGAGGLKIVGAFYDVETGKVTFLQ